MKDEFQPLEINKKAHSLRGKAWEKNCNGRTVWKASKTEVKSKDHVQEWQAKTWRFLWANKTFDIKRDVLIDFSGFELGLLIGLKLLCQKSVPTKG